MDYKQIQDLIKLVGKTNVSELRIEEDKFKIVIRSKDYVGGSVVHQVAAPAQVMQTAAPQAMPAAAATESTPKAEENAAEAPASSSTIDFKSPMIGTFYRSSAPEKPPFKNVGDTVKQGDVVCIIEAMKLFNEIEYEGPEGRIVKVLVDDASPVEYDHGLFQIEPI